MTGNDVLFFRRCHAAGLVRSPLLEIGSARVEPGKPNLCDLARSLDLGGSTGVDLEVGPGVDIAFDFSLPAVDFASLWQHGVYATVAVFNVLEHTYDPAGLLRNARRCVAPGGTLLVSSPAIWTLHDFPRDFVRLMPHWYEEFAKQAGLILREDAFCWMSLFGITPIGRLQHSHAQYEFPTFLTLGRSRSPVRYWTSRVVHRLFNTFGRSHSFANVAIGCAFVSPSCAQPAKHAR